MDFGFDLRYYLLLIRRRILYILVPFAVVLILSVAVAMKLPSVYQSTGTILIESQQIPDTFVRSTVTSVASERIGIIKQRVMTRTNILRISKKYGLFPREGESASVEKSVDAVHKAIEVAPVTDNSGGFGGRRGGTFAFTVSFEHEDPEIAVGVATELVSLFLQENIRNRSARATETTNFLKQESGKLQRQVDEIERHIAEYKERNRGSLPEHLNFTISSLERAKANLEATNNEIKSAQAERRLLDIQLSAARSGLSLKNDPYVTRDGLLSPEQELSQLQTELLKISAIYDPSHPDVVTLRRKIAALKGQFQGQGDRTYLRRQLDEISSQIEATQARYSNQHPDIKRLSAEKKRIAAQLAALPKRPAKSSPGSRTSITDPLFAHALAQIETADSHLKELQSQRSQLKKKIDELESQMIQAPMVERGLNALNRDYKTAVKKYDEIKAKEMEAQLAENLEDDRKAERLSLLEPPIRPEAPVKPKRLKIIAFGLALALAAGGGGLLFIESIDNSIRGVAGYRATLKQSPLIAIPYIHTAAETRQRRLHMVGFLISAVVLIMVAAIVIHFSVKPIDAIFLSVLTRIS